MTAEIGRQPWLVYNLVRTAGSESASVGAGTTLFSLLGFMGMYTLLAILWILLVYHIIENGPTPATTIEPSQPSAHLLGEAR
jgi:cytochrome d ubiquinol oxidase subunit I